ncbi:hypothetical protein EDB85DRAFT_2273535 [Lactarius pseudohatsudake]|nr:hypothetical protein EDB85DRAFT_2273535 [Lactarius pseudohatsudake]
MPCHRHCSLLRHVTAAAVDLAPLESSLVTLVSLVDVLLLLSAVGLARRMCTARGDLAAGLARGRKVSVSRTAVSAVAHTARVAIPIAAVIIPVPSPFPHCRHSRTVTIPAPSPFPHHRHSHTVAIPTPSPFPRHRHSPTAIPAPSPLSLLPFPLAPLRHRPLRRGRGRGCCRGCGRGSRHGVFARSTRAVVGRRCATDLRRRCAVVVQPTRAVVAPSRNRLAPSLRGCAVVVRLTRAPSSGCRRAVVTLLVIRHGCVALAWTQAAAVVVVVVCSGVACPRAAVAAVVTAVAVRGTLDLEEKKKVGGGRICGVGNVCHRQDAGHVDNCPVRFNNQGFNVNCYHTHRRWPHRLHGRHHAGTQPTTTPLPVPWPHTPPRLTTLASAQFLRYVLQSRRRGLCLVARKSVVAASNSSPPPPAYHRHLQPIAAASNPLPRPPTHRRSLQPIAAASDSSPHPSPLSPLLTARKGLHNDTVCCRYDGDEDGNAEGDGGGDVEGDGGGGGRRWR